MCVRMREHTSGKLTPNCTIVLILINENRFIYCYSFTHIPSEIILFKKSMTTMQKENEKQNRAKCVPSSYGTHKKGVNWIKDTSIFTVDSWQNIAVAPFTRYYSIYLYIFVSGWKANKHKKGVKNLFTIQRQYYMVNRKSN